MIEYTLKTDTEKVSIRSAKEVYHSLAKADRQGLALVDVRDILRVKEALLPGLSPHQVPGGIPTQWLNMLSLELRRRVSKERIAAVLAVAYS